MFEEIFKAAVTRLESGSVFEVIDSKAHMGPQAPPLVWPCKQDWGVVVTPNAV